MTGNCIDFEATTDYSLDAPSGIQCAGATDIGKRRPTNEDHFLIAGLRKVIHILQSSLSQPANQYSHERGLILIVADGMGGYRGGEHASALAVKTMEELLLDAFAWVFAIEAVNDSALTEFQDALRKVDERVMSESARNPHLRGMGTTLTMAFIVQKRLFVAHVGDSRCYLFREGKLHQLTRDHTLVQELVRAGKLNESAARKHNLRNIVTNVVGGVERGVAAEVHQVELQSNDRVLLCTDGLHGMLSHEEMESMVQSEAIPSTICERLIEAANQAGGNDNITVILANV